MKTRVVVHAIGWFVAFLAIIFATFAAVRFTLERLPVKQPKSTARTIPPPPDKSVREIPKPIKLPPDYTVFVFCYHDFREPANKWSISPKRLEAHIQTLKALDFTFLTVSEAVKLLTGQWKGEAPKRAVVITVDDGFQSAYSVLFPLLKRYKAKATLFVYTDWIGKNRGALTWEQLQEMAQSGLVEIASHTVTHAYPRKLKQRMSYEQFKRKMEWEFVQSKTELERKLGVKIEGLAYPGGYADGTLKALAQKAGYKWAAMINPKPLTVYFDRYAIPRYGVSTETTVAVLKAWVTKKPIALVRLNAQKESSARKVAKVSRP